MRMIRADITRDGIPETLLAYSQHDYRKTCKRATQCAIDNADFHHEVVIGAYGDSDHYTLLPMNDLGTQVDWSHRIVGEVPMLYDGELVYYKGRPYWLTTVDWMQSRHDTPPFFSARADNPHSNIFHLAPIAFVQVGQRGGPIRPTHFGNVEYLTGDIQAAV